MKTMMMKSNITTCFFIGFMLTACSDKPPEGAALPVFEMNIDGTTIKGLMGSEGSLNLPEWVPDNFPTPAGGRIFYSSQNSKKNGTLIIGTEQTAETLENYYFDKLKNDNWESSLMVNGKAQVTYSMNKTQVIVNVNENRKNKNHSEATIMFTFEE